MRRIHANTPGFESEWFSNVRRQALKSIMFHPVVITAWRVPACCPLKDIDTEEEEKPIPMVL